MLLQSPTLSQTNKDIMWVKVIGFDIGLLQATDAVNMAQSWLGRNHGKCLAKPLLYLIISDQ